MPPPAAIVHQPPHHCSSPGGLGRSGLPGFAAPGWAGIPPGHGWAFTTGAGPGGLGRAGPGGRFTAITAARPPGHIPALGHRWPGPAPSRAHGHRVTFVHATAGARRGLPAIRAQPGQQAGHIVPGAPGTAGRASGPGVRRRRAGGRAGARSRHRHFAARFPASPAANRQAAIAVRAARSHSVGADAVCAPACAPILALQAITGAGCAITPRVPGNYSAPFRAIFFQFGSSRRNYFTLIRRYTPAPPAARFYRRQAASAFATFGHRFQRVSFRLRIIPFRHSPQIPSPGLIRPVRHNRRRLQH